MIDPIAIKRDDTKPQITLFDPLLNVDYPPMYGSTCARCQRVNVHTTPLLVLYPGVSWRADCCEDCKDEISATFDKAMKELGL